MSWKTLKASWAAIKSCLRWKHLWWLSIFLFGLAAWFGVPWPPGRELVMDWLVDLDEWLVNVTAYPGLFAFVMGLVFGTIAIPEIVRAIDQHFVKRHERQNADMFLSEFHAHNQTDARAKLFSDCDIAYRQAGYQDLPGNLADLLRGVQLPRGLPLSQNDRIIDWISLHCDNLPSSDWRLWEFVQRLYPRPPRPSDDLAKFDAHRRMAAKFWDRWGYKFKATPNLMTDNTVRSILKANAQQLKLLVYLELAQLRQDMVDSGPGKSGLFDIAQMAVSMEDGNRDGGLHTSLRRRSAA